MSSYVIADIEWVDKCGFINPTQLSAIKTDKNWNDLQSFSQYIKPHDEKFRVWKHVAYTGGTAEQFLHAKSAYQVLADFDGWLDEEDVIVWWSASGREAYTMLFKAMHKREPKNEQVVLGEYLCAFLNGTGLTGRNPYIIARELKMPVSGKEHDSFCDVVTELKVLKQLKFPQDALKIPPVNVGRTASPAALRYAYDGTKNLVHLARGSCEYSSLSSFTGDLARLIKKGVRPCRVCMEKEYEERKRKICRDIIERMGCEFIYTPRSAVFHRAACNMVRLALDVKGCRKYATATATGRRPCKFCNPTEEDELKKKPKKAKVKSQKKSGKERVKATSERPIAGSAELQPKQPDRETVKAIKRLRQAKEDRYSGALQAAKTKEEKRDILTLTATENAFWVGAGYQNFHIRNCPRLKDIRGLTGFKTYNDAVSAGFTPCKTCRPTARHNVRVSFPIQTRERVDEKVADLYTWCAAYGYPCSEEEGYFCLQTPVGKWKIDLQSKPVKLKHINLTGGKPAEEYHDQPRLFLSWTDAIQYIRRHDETLRLALKIPKRPDRR